MTLVRIFRGRPSPGGDVPAGGVLRFTPTRGRVVPGDPAMEVLPVPFSVEVPAGSGRLDVLLAPTGPDWCWEVYSHGFGVPAEREYVAVPDVEEKDFRELSRVDPSTLDPVAVPEAAWWAALAGAMESVQSIWFTVDPDDPDVLVIHYPSFLEDDGAVRVPITGG